MSNQSNVIAFADEAHLRRRARGAFVKSLIEKEERSARFVAIRIGLGPSSMSERLKGKSPFLADELEGIARVLRIDPVEFYAQYIQAGNTVPNDPDRRTLVPKVAGSIPVGGTIINFPTRQRAVVERTVLAPVVPIMGGAA